MDCLNTVSCMLYRDSVIPLMDQGCTYCSLHPLGGCFLYVTRNFSMNLIKYNVYIRWCMRFIINICVIQTMENFPEFSFKSVLMPEYSSLTLLEKECCGEEVQRHRKRTINRLYISLQDSKLYYTHVQTGHFSNLSAILEQAF